MSSGSGGAFAHCMPTLPDCRRHPRGHEACIVPYREFRKRLTELAEMNGLQTERRAHESTAALKNDGC
jgi:hypothetical protein